MRMVFNSQRSMRIIFQCAEAYVTLYVFLIFGSKHGVIVELFVQRDFGLPDCWQP